MPPTPLTWPDAAAAFTDYGVTVTDAQLETARQECLRELGLALDTATPPTVAFREGVALQALANRHATQADSTDYTGAEFAGVRLYPMCKLIRNKLITSSPDADDATRDLGRVRGLIG